MNRIRKYNDKYQVLVTPARVIDAGFEMMLGDWSDANLETYDVRTVATLQDALAISFDYPDISWTRFVLWHENDYRRLYQLVKRDIASHKYSVEMTSSLLSALQLKNTMFDRVSKYGTRFKTNEHVNDIITFYIVNPYTDNITNLSTIFIANPALRIMYKSSAKGIIRLVGKTDIGTTYEILLMTTLVSQWAKWEGRNDLPERKDANMDKLGAVLKDQAIIDKNRIR